MHLVDIPRWAFWVDILFGFSGWNFPTKMINLGYQIKTFPDCMKVANIKPLHKKKSTDDITNYRPISILPTLSKLFERAPTDQIVSYLESNNLISRNQHAYRKGHSTQTCLVELTNLLYEHMDKGMYSGIASLDLSKAYDSISHTLLLHKLAKLGLAEESLMWIKSYKVKEHKGQSLNT